MHIIILSFLVPNLVSSIPQKQDQKILSSDHLIIRPKHKIAHETFNYSSIKTDKNLQVKAAPTSLEFSKPLTLHVVCNSSNLEIQGESPTKYLVDSKTSKYVIIYAPAQFSVGKRSLLKPGSVAY